MLFEVQRLSDDAYIKVYQIHVDTTGDVSFLIYNTSWELSAASLYVPIGNKNPI